MVLMIIADCSLGCVYGFDREKSSILCGMWLLMWGGLELVEL